MPRPVRHHAREGGERSADKAIDSEPSPDALRRKLADSERRLRLLEGKMLVLERERQKLSAVLHHADAGFLSLDISRRVVWTNEIFGARFGQGAGAGTFLGQPCHQVLCERPSPCEECPAARSLSSGRVAHHELRRGPGDRGRDIYATAMPIRSMTGGIDETIVMLQDVSDLNVLRQSEARKSSVLETSLDAIVSMDDQGRVTEFNRAAEGMFGFTRAEAIGQELSQLIIPIALRERHRQGLARYIRTGESRIMDRRLEMTALRKDGSEFPVEIVITRIRVPGPPALTGFIRDLSERKDTEAALHDSEEQLRMSQKLEAVGRLAGGIAHDFNNLLTVISGRCEILRSRVPGNAAATAEIDLIRDAGERAAALTHQLLAFSRRQVLAPKVLDLNSSIASLLPMLQRLIGEDIDLKHGAGPGLGRVKADPGQIEQVIMNLAVNARDAMADGGTLIIETRNVDLDEIYARQHAPAPPGPYVMLAVSDTGTGMTHEIQARIFEPFFTTKERGKGTGLGLATVYGIVKQSGGYIWVYSELGHGTTFKIYLPRVEEAIAEAAPAAAPRPAMRGSETILLVEDEEVVRKLAREVLESRGYRVLDARGGEEALQICERFEGTIHLMLTDVVMPRMSGRTLADKIVASRPDVRVLFMSGYTDDAIAHHGVLEVGLDYLPKPFTIESLTGKVREVLARPAATSR